MKTGMTTVINILLIAVCLYLVLIGAGRRLARSKAAFQRIRNDPEAQKWLRENLTGNKTRDLQAVRSHFRLPARYAAKLLQTHFKE